MEGQECGRCMASWPRPYGWTMFKPQPNSVSFALAFDSCLILSRSGFRGLGGPSPLPAAYPKQCLGFRVEPQPLHLLPSSQMRALGEVCRAYSAHRMYMIFIVCSIALREVPADLDWVLRPHVHDQEERCWTAPPQPSTLNPKPSTLYPQP